MNNTASAMVTFLGSPGQPSSKNTKRMYSAVERHSAALEAGVVRKTTSAICMNATSGPYTSFINVYVPPDLLMTSVISAKDRAPGIVGE